MADKKEMVINAQIPFLVEIFEDEFPTVDHPPSPAFWGKPLIGALAKP